MIFKDKKTGFTLAEIVIALAIVGIITALTVPIVARQISKTEEYAYYAAFKAVEKMGSQIVMNGEPESEAYAEPEFEIANGMSVFVTRAKQLLAFIPQKIVNSEQKVFRKLFPKVFAETQKVTFTENESFSSDDYDYLWLRYKVCSGVKLLKGYQTVTTTNADGTTSTSNTPVYYTTSDFSEDGDTSTACAGITTDKTTDEGTVIKNSAIDDFIPTIDDILRYSTETIRNNLADYIIDSSDSRPNAGDFCSKVYTYLKSPSDGTLSKAYEADDDDGGDDEGEDSYTGVVYESPVYGECKFTITRTKDIDVSGSSDVKYSRPQFTDEDCGTSRGFYNMYNAGKPDTINCEPKSGYNISENNNKVACKEDSGKVSYASCSTTEGCSCITCPTTSSDSTSFNEDTGACCPLHSTYSGSTCECNPGWGGTNCQTRTGCSNGYTLKNEVCVLNPPIMKAKRLCELIRDSWNISKSYCESSMFKEISDLSGTTYYKDVYESALGAGTATNGIDTSKILMSLDAKEGAFLYNQKTGTGLKPNIILGNGQYLWILSDRTASIPGLTYTTMNSTPSRNVCKNLKKYDSTSCTNAGGYFCSSENGCYTMALSSLYESSQGLGDARNCCSTPNLADITEESSINPNYSTTDYYKDVRYYAISGFTIFVDINGKKGSGTLWEDVFPFYVSSNGRVYPGYPLDGEKGSNTTNNTQQYGGNNAKLLPVDVYYFDTSSGTKKKKVAYSNISYARALCIMNKVSQYSPYCSNLGTKFKNTSSACGSSSGKTCFMTLRQKLRTF